MSNIRKAESADAMALSRVAEETFRATFGAVNSVANMAHHCNSSYSEEIQAREISNPDMVTLLCEQSGNLVGFAQLRWGKVPDCVAAENPGEIQRLYVVDAWHGKGVAQALMDACIREIEQRGSDVIWLGVWENNPRAISFYRKNGFTEAGNHVFPLGDDPQRDLVMVGPVAARQPIQTVAAVIANAEGDVLLVRKRSSAIFIQPGGKTEPGEAALTTLARELNEELGVCLDPASAGYLGEFEAVAVNEPGRRVRTRAYVCQVIGSPEVQAEIEEMVWVNPRGPYGVPVAPLSATRILPAFVALSGNAAHGG